MEAYGPVALGVWFSLFGLTFAGSAALITAGYQGEGVSATAGTVAGAYLLTQLTKPVRIAVTLALTPGVAWALGRRRPPPASTEPE